MNATPVCNIGWISPELNPHARVSQKAPPTATPTSSRRCRCPQLQQMKLGRTASAMWNMLAFSSYRRTITSTAPPTPRPSARVGWLSWLCPPLSSGVFNPRNLDQDDFRDCHRHGPSSIDSPPSFTGLPSHLPTPSPSASPPSAPRVFVTSAAAPAAAAVGGAPPTSALA